MDNYLKTISPYYNTNVLKIHLFSWKQPQNWIPNIKQLCRNIKYAYQRVVYGFCKYDTFDLDVYYTTLMINSLTEFSKNTQSYPGTMTCDEWHKILDEIVFHLKNSLEDYTENDCYKKVQDSFNEMHTYVASIKEQKETIDGQDYYRLEEQYTDAEKYELARQKYVQCHKEFEAFRESEKNKALDMLKEHWYNLWD